jgi:hypothetical protein
LVLFFKKEPLPSSGARPATAAHAQKPPPSENAGGEPSIGHPDDDDEDSLSLMTLTLSKIITLEPFVFTSMFIAVEVNLMRSCPRACLLRVEKQSRSSSLFLRACLSRLKST